MPTTPVSSGYGSSSDWQSEVSDPRQFLSSLKVDLYPDEVYTFTPEGGGLRLPARRDPDRLRLPRPHGRRPSVRGRARQREARAAAYAARERRHRRDPDGPEPGAVARLALLRRHEPRPAQDPPLHPHGGETPGGRARAAPARAGAQEVQAHRQEARRRGQPLPRAQAVGLLEARGPLRGDRLREARAAGGPRALHSGRGARPARGRAPGIGSLARRPQDPALRGSGHRGRGAQRPARRARQVLQPGARREDRRLHHARPGRLGPLAELPERAEPALRPRAPDRRGLGGGEAGVLRHRARGRHRRPAGSSRPTSPRRSPGKARTSGGSRPGSGRPGRATSACRSRRRT